MSLKDVELKKEYRSLLDNVVQDFYIPLLKDATLYQRAVGFFSSSSLVEISKGIAAMAEAGGKIQIVASPYLSDEDIEAIKKGYADRDKIIEGALIASLSDEHIDYYSMERLNLLANLIATGVLDIRIAYTEDSKGIGMYHEKMGIITDAEGNHVAFSGSMNESATAMLVNYETIDVFRSWGDESEQERVTLKQNAFFSIWNDTEPNIHVLEFPKVTETLIEKYRKKAPDFGLDRQQYSGARHRHSGSAFSQPTGARVPKEIEFHEYQKEAIASWAGENYRGIYDMATGTGKTYTGLGSIAKISEDLDDELAVIIVCPYQHLVEQWVEDIIKFNMKPIIGYSASAQKDWKRDFPMPSGTKRSEMTSGFSASSRPTPHLRVTTSRNRSVRSRCRFYSWSMRHTILEPARMRDVSMIGSLIVWLFPLRLSDTATTKGLHCFITFLGKSVSSIRSAVPLMRIN